MKTDDLSQCFPQFTDEDLRRLADAISGNLLGEFRWMKDGTPIVDAPEFETLVEFNARLRGMSEHEWDYIGEQIAASVAGAWYQYYIQTASGEVNLIFSSLNSRHVTFAYQETLLNDATLISLGIDRLIGKSPEWHRD